MVFIIQSSTSTTILASLQRYNIFKLFSAKSLQKCDTKDFVGTNLAIYLTPDTKKFVEEGVTIKNVDLAGTLDIIGEKGSKAYYDGGELTKSIIDAVSNCFCPFYHPSLSGGGGGFEEPIFGKGRWRTHKEYCGCHSYLFLSIQEGEGCGESFSGRGREQW